MVVIGRERFEDVYETLKEGAVESLGTCSVVLFVAADVDALCTCRMITSLLKEDNVVFKVCPVSGYTEAAGAAQGLDDGVRTIFMINCGAMANIREVVECGEKRVLVLDSHRPVHIKNVHSPHVIVLDADGDLEDVPSDGDDDFDSDSEEEEEDDSDDEEEEDERPKRKKKEVSERRKRLRAYYDGTYDAIPSSILAFAMCDALSRATPTDVWLGSLGLAAVRDQWRITDVNFDEFLKFLSKHLRQMEAVRAAALRPVADNHQHVGNVEPGQVTYDGREPRFFLHRHLAFFDSMYYSNYVAATLSVWKQDGTQKLRELLARMGISIEQSKQKYTFLPPSTRRVILPRLEEYGPRYGLDTPFRAAFRRSVDGCSDPVSNADAAAAVEALLEEPTARRLDDDDDEATSRQAFIAGFWRAYDACLSEDPDLTIRGVQAAVTLQKAVVTVAVTLIEKRDITTLKHFRYCYLNASGSINDVFTQPHALRKLAMFLFGVHQHNGKWSGDKARPLVVLAERHDTFLVLGVNPDAQRNRFGTNFRLAVDHVNANFRHDWFDTAVIEVMRPDVQRYVSVLSFLIFSFPQLRRKPSLPHVEVGRDSDVLSCNSLCHRVLLASLLLWLVPTQVQIRLPTTNTSFDDDYRPPYSYDL